MRQRNLAKPRKQRLRELRQARHNEESFMGTCSSCKDKNVEVKKVKNAQICVRKCLARALSRLGGVIQTPEAQAIKVDSNA